MFARFCPYSQRRIRKPVDGARGASAVEFAIVLPMFLTLFMIIFALALWLFSVLLGAAALPLGARTFGVSHSAAAGMGRVQRIMGVTGPFGAAAAQTQMGVGTPGCQRAAYARLNASSGMNLPLVGDFVIHLRAGSVTRLWQFWPGEPPDCE